VPPFFFFFFYSFLYLVLLFQVSVSGISSVLLLNVVPLFYPVPKLLNIKSTEFPQHTRTTPSLSLFPIGLDHFPTRPLPRINTGYFPAKFSFTPYLPVKMELPECSETSAFNIQTPGKYPEKNIPDFVLH
jgi:hypothetical protein